MNATHDPRRQSWVPSANRGGNAFPIQNLPFGVFASADAPTIGVAIGDQILNLRACEDLLPMAVREACAASTLNPLMAGGSERWSELRAALSAEGHQRVERRRRTGLLHRRRQQVRAAAQVQNLISYGDTDRRRIRARKNAEG